MEKNNGLEKKLQEILTAGDFDRLHPFKEGDAWKSMTSRERDLLGILFLTQGEAQFKKGETSAHNSFELAARISPQNPHVFYRQAVAYAEQEYNAPALLSAIQALQVAVTLSPRFFEAWCLWGKVAMHLGNLHQDSSYFQEAYDKFTEAQHHSSTVSSEVFSGLYWQWGRCSYFSGKLSGEACDFRLALDKYRQAAELGLQDADFWNDYGDAVMELGDLIGKMELLFEATELYRKSTVQSPGHYKAWLNLACNCQRLFEYSHEEDYFHAAHEGFEQALELNPEDGILWFNWAQLFANAGKIKWDLEKLQISFEKFAKADQYEPNHPLILSHWGEVEMLYGAFEEKLELLRAAEAKFLKSLQLEPDSAHLWYMYGCCLNELGCYFEDERYYWQAIEKLRYGLTLNESDPLIWYALSLAHFAIGDLNDDMTMIEKSITYCCRVMEFGGALSSQFWNDWGISYMKLAEITHDRSLVEMALEKFAMALSPHEEDLTHETLEPEWLYNYGCALDLLGDFTGNAQEYERAIESFTKALEVDPTYQHARFNLALAYSHLGEVTSEIDFFFKSLEQFELLLREDNEDEMAWNECGVTLLNLAILVYDPTHPEKSSKLYALAENKISHAIALGCTQAFYSLAGLYSLMGNYPASVHYLERSETAGVLPHIEDLMNDEWLENVRATQLFLSFIAHLTNKYGKGK